MGIFGDTDFDEVDDEIFGIPSDWYHLIITNDEVKAQKNQEDIPDEDKVYRHNIEFTVAEGEYEDDKMMISFRIRKPNETDKQAKRDRTSYKLFMIACGLSVGEMNLLEPGDLTKRNIHLYAYCEKNGNFTNPSQREGHIRLWKPEDSAGSSHTDSSDGLGIFGG
jgi:hypothetical protein